MSQAPFVRPPRIAVWLVDLFTPTEQTEPIPGDLLEEFSELASKSGFACARRWYWRQSVKTIAHLIATGFVVTPGLIARTVVGGWLLGWAGYWFTQKAVVAVLYKYQVYAHIDAYAFWLIYAVLIERLIEPFIIGCIIAVAAKGREMVVTMTLGLIIAAWSGAGLAHFRHHWSEPNFPLAPLLLTTFVSPVMFVIGGGIVREIRSAMSRRPSATHC
jgi:uncharacterized membrane protein